MAIKCVSAALADRALVAIEREADMDGLVIVSGRYLASQLGVDQSTANEAIRLLVAEGRLRQDGRSETRGHTRIIRLADTS